MHCSKFVSMDTFSTYNTYVARVPCFRFWFPVGSPQPPLLRLCTFWLSSRLVPGQGRTLRSTSSVDKKDRQGWPEGGAPLSDLGAPEMITLEDWKVLDNHIG